MPRAHDPFLSILTLNGLPIPPTGRDDFITFDEIPDESSNAVGIDGEVTNTVIRNKYRTASITVNRQSAAHGLISGIYAAWKLTLRRGRFPFGFRNLNNGDAATGVFWFIGTPDMGTGREDSDVVWRIAIQAEVWTFSAGGLFPNV